MNTGKVVRVNLLARVLLDNFEPLRILNLTKTTFMEVFYDL